MSTLAAWQNFYAIVGSSAGALIGLQFVVLSLVAGIRTVRVGDEGGRAFSTPTIVHFSVVLTVAAVISAPWRAAASAVSVCGGLGVAGLVYSVVVTRRLRRQTSYRLEFEDWMFHVVLPLGTYAGLAGSGWAARWWVHEGLMGIGGAVVVLLFIGIHNAWDTVTYHVFVKRAGAPEGEPKG
ncbi:MAG: hypothetical protein KGN36_08875 [Acidobacteriota bacterium]|nr:hypothetical protein [Acidobacteriota bacterium]